MHHRNNQELKYYLNGVELFVLGFFLCQQGKVFIKSYFPISKTLLLSISTFVFPFYVCYICFSQLIFTRLIINYSLYIPNTTFCIYKYGTMVKANRFLSRVFYAFKQYNKTKWTKSWLLVKLIFLERYKVANLLLQTIDITTIAS